MRTRIIGLSVLAAVIAIGLFGIPLAAMLVRYSIHDERNELERVADLAAVMTSVDLARGVSPNDLPARSPSRTLGIYDPTGRRILGDGPPMADRVTSKARRHILRSTDGGDIVVAVPMATGDSLLGVVRASTPRTETYLKIGIAWLFMAGLAIVAVGAVWLLARSMAAKLSRPLERLAITAHTLGDGDFSARFQACGVPEIDTVVSALNSTATRLSDLVARERAFSTDASHQLRTPLTALRLGLEVALEDPQQDLRQTVANAISGTDRLQRTIEDLLALARDGATAREPLALGTLLDELTQTWRPRLTEQGRELKLIVGSRIPVTGASAAAVRQILAVLMDNAVTHGGATVTVNVRDAGQALAVEVSDQGPGITVPSAQLFARRDPSVTGHGIGLALARRLAEAEGARLRLANPAPTTFTLLMPAWDRAEVATD